MPAASRPQLVVVSAVDLFIHYIARSQQHTCRRPRGEREKAQSFFFVTRSDCNCIISCHNHRAMPPSSAVGVVEEGVDGAVATKGDHGVWHVWALIHSSKMDPNAPGHWPRLVIDPESPPSAMTLGVEDGTADNTAAREGKRGVVGASMTAAVWKMGEGVLYVVVYCL